MEREQLNLSQLVQEALQDSPTMSYYWKPEEIDICVPSPVEAAKIARLLQLQWALEDFEYAMVNGHVNHSKISILNEDP